MNVLKLLFDQMQGHSEDPAVLELIKKAQDVFVEEEEKPQTDRSLVPEEAPDSKDAMPKTPKKVEESVVVEEESVPTKKEGSPAKEETESIKEEKKGEAEKEESVKDDVSFNTDDVEEEEEEEDASESESEDEEPEKEK